jgi:hypothetical protein
MEVPIMTLVGLLADRWRSRCRDLDNYLRSTFGVPAPNPIPTRLHLSQMANGSVRPENIGSMFAAVWLVELGSVREVPLDFEWQTRWNTDELDIYFLTHAYSFVVEGEDILLSERYGSALRHRSRCRLFIGPPLTADWSTCWTTGPEQVQAEPGDAVIHDGI